MSAAGAAGAKEPPCSPLPSLPRRLLFSAAFFGGLLALTLFFIPVGPLCWLRQRYLPPTATPGQSPKTASPMTGKVAGRFVIHFYGRLICRLMGLLVPLRLNLPADLPPWPQPCIVTANHQSFFDPYCIGLLPMYNLAYVVRGWPFRIPLYGRFMRWLEYLDTENLPLEAFFSKASDLLAQGVNIVMFPEGTRSPDGKLGRFHSGAFKLALENDTPIVPMCLEGSGKVFPKGKRLGYIAPITVTILPPIRPDARRKAEPGAHLLLRNQVKDVMQKHLEAAATGTT